MTDQIKEELSYKDTINLPQTEFPMKGNGPVREPEIQKFWDDSETYKKIILLREEKNIGRFVLHDGPPYLSSDKIHIGTALNKILKDIIVKYKTLRGYLSPYIPGYDCHGLPIENAVLKLENTSREKIAPVELRKKCTAFAMTNRAAQEKKFRRLGVLGDWTNAYMTLDPKFEAKQLQLFGDMVEKGYIYRGLKAVYWSYGCQTALAEAEIEYVDNYKSPSIYVGFPIVSYSKEAIKLQNYNNLRVVIWTTTPWTIPSNLAICLHPQFEYAVIKSIKFGYLLVASELLDSFNKKIEEDCVILEKIKGKDLEGSIAQHPLFKRQSPLILGEHVTLDAGTGCVHTAPGHGMEDFEIGQKYSLGILSPVDAKGNFTSEAGEDFAGLFVHKEGNQKVIEKLQSAGALLILEDCFHSYPHCWRSKTPIIFRATEQWFCSVEKFRLKALEEIENVQWIPAMGKNRIKSMVESRSDWCISRQRTWGVPIPAFYLLNSDGSIKETLLNKEIIEYLSPHIAKFGSNIWWEWDVDKLLPEKYKSIDKALIKKETDTMDVWFDSGSTHSSVVDLRSDEFYGTSPVEMYLEGSDQHRGWFQSSLLTSVATKGIAPYKTVLTHGFVVDEHGKKMSKSLGNVVDPDKVIDQLGVDILRLWVSSVDYSVDLRIGSNMLKQLSEVYRNIRNTSRFMLGNLYDFNEADDFVEYAKLPDIDKYVLHKLENFKEEITQCMDSYQFFKYYQILQNFCSVDLSSFYFDLNKDRLYTSGKKSHSRRSAQTVLMTILKTLTPILVPVLPHLAEDIWFHIPKGIKKEVDSALMLNWPSANTMFINKVLCNNFDQIILFKQDVFKALETARAEKKIGKSLEAKISVFFNPSSVSLKNILVSNIEELPIMFIVSQVDLNLNALISDFHSKFESDNYSIFVTPADGEKCPRCWKYSTDIGYDKAHSIICKPCALAVEGKD